MLNIQDSWRVTATDLYDFMRCPRILAFKLIGIKLEKWHCKTYRSSQVSPVTIGRIGEEVVAQVLRLHGAISLTETGIKLPKKTSEVRDMSKIKSMKDIKASITESIIFTTSPVTLSSAKCIIKTMIERSIEGALRVVEYLKSRFGEPLIFSRARVTNTLLQTTGEPDFIIGFPGDKYVIIEIKNTKQVAKEHQVKVGYYVKASKIAGASILMERRTKDKLEFIPVDTNNVSGGVVIYPRLARIRNAYIPELTTEVISRIMKLKYIAMNGLVPADANSSYCSRCRYREICRSISGSKVKDLNEVKLPIPAPITAALELSEKHGIDLDALFHGAYYRRLYFKVVENVMNKHEILTSLPVSTKEIAKFLENVINVPYTDIYEALEHYNMYKDLLSQVVENENILPSTFNALLNISKSKEEALRLAASSLYNTIRTCAYPSKSLERVKEAYTKLRKLVL